MKGNFLELFSHYEIITIYKRDTFCNILIDSFIELNVIRHLVIYAEI